MPTDDVLERAESWLGSYCRGLTHRLERVDRLVSDLAAKVRELRRDKARLDWVMRNAALIPRSTEADDGWLDEGREVIDAAMKGEDFE